MKKTHLIALIAIGLVIVATVSWLCFDNSVSTNTKSSKFKTNAQKIAFLKKYVKLFSKISATEFHISYQDNSSGCSVPGPSYWDMKLVLKMSVENVFLWIKGLKKYHKPISLKWGYQLVPQTWKISSQPEIYIRNYGKAIVAVFRKEGIVFKRILSEPLRAGIE